MELQVGQKLWFVPSERRWQNPVTVEVVKIGRSWVTLDRFNHRFAIDDKNMWIDGGQYSSPGRCYLSQQEWEAEEASKKAWSNLCDSIKRHSPPAGVTVEKIEAARKLLGL